MSELNETASDTTEQQPSASRLSMISCLKTSSGILKVLELLLGSVCFGIMCKFGEVGYIRDNSVQFFFLMTTTFTIGTFNLVVNFFTSSLTKSATSKIYELVFHLMAFVLLLAASCAQYSTTVSNWNDSEYDIFLWAAICGLVNSVLYLLSSAILVFQLFRVSYPADNISMSELNSSATVTTAPHSSALYINFNIGYLKTFRAILKLLELLMGIICVVLIGYSFVHYPPWNAASQTFFLVTTAFMINTFILILSSLVELSSEPILSDTNYEYRYDTEAFGLNFVAALYLLRKLSTGDYDECYEITLAACVASMPWTSNAA